VGRLLESLSSDTWELALNNAIGLDAAPVLLFGLALAADFTGASLPAVIRHAIEDEKAFHRRLNVTKRCIDLAPKAPLLAAAMLQLQLHHGLRRWAEYGRRHLFVPTAGDWEQFRLRPPLLFLYPVLRPFRLTIGRLFPDACKSTKARAPRAGKSLSQYPPE
jgi:hypothetical protein